MSRIKGSHLTEEHKRKIAESQMGIKNHRFGKKNSKKWHSIMDGKPSWNKGKKLSKEHKKRLSESHKGFHNSINTQFKKGYIPFNKGKEFMPREKHWNWKGGIKNLIRRDERSDSAYRRWCNEVKRRDKYTCRLKNKYCLGKNIAHHIIAWKNNKSLRYIVSNGITLCKFHHPLKIKDEKKMINKFKILVKKSF